MPIYSYFCEKCKTTTEIYYATFLKASKDDCNAKCEKCGGNVKRVISSTAKPVIN